MTRFHIKTSDGASLATLEAVRLTPTQFEGSLVAGRLSGDVQSLMDEIHAAGEDLALSVVDELQHEFRDLGLRAVLEDVSVFEFLEVVQIIRVIGSDRLRVIVAEKG